MLTQSEIGGRSFASSTFDRMTTPQEAVRT